MRAVLLVLFVGAVAALGTFVVVYARRRGWRTPAGRMLLAMNAAWLAFCLLLLSGLDPDGVPGAVWVVALGFLDVALWGQVRLLLQAGRAPAVRSAGGFAHRGGVTASDPPRRRVRGPLEDDERKE